MSEPAPLLLDANVLIWTISSSHRVSARARRAMSHRASSLAVSVVSVWEIVLKHQAGKLRLDTGIEEVVEHILYRSPWAILPILPQHLSALANLPILHKDPFGRLLIAQARHEGMTILTADARIWKYDVPTIW